MENLTQSILQQDFAKDICKVADDHHFMNGLLKIAKSSPIDEKMGNKIKEYTLDYLKKASLKDFNRYSDKSYVREYIGRDSSGWEAIVMSWKKGNVTAIHTHPQFAAYNFADGEFLVEIFEYYKDGLKCVNKIVVNEQIGLFAIGEAGKFTNHIHRITCLSDTGHSLHIYSDDALKGAKLDHLKIYE